MLSGVLSREKEARGWRGGGYQLCVAPTSSGQGSPTTSCPVVSGSSEARFIPLFSREPRELLWRLKACSSS